MGRRAFTLIELLTIVAIIGIMIATAVLSVTSGQRAVRVKGATRDIFAAIRRARSTALVTQQPAIVTYSTEMVDGEPVAKVEITSAKLFDEPPDRSKVETVTGAPLLGSRHRNELVHIEPEGGDGTMTEGGKEEGISVMDILFAPMSSEAVRGMRLKVAREGDSDFDGVKAQQKSKISVFSNVDYLIGRFKDAKAAAKEEEKKKEAESGAQTEAPPVGQEAEEPVSIVWETNGRVEAHRVWVYPDGARPEDGLMVKVDAFGGAKVVSGDGREE